MAKLKLNAAQKKHIRRRRRPTTQRFADLFFFLVFRSVGTLAAKRERFATCNGQMESIRHRWLIMCT